MRDFSEPVDDLDLIYAVYAWAKSSMDAEDSIVNDARERQIVKHVCEMVPYGGVAVFPATFCVEAI